MADSRRKKGKRDQNVLVKDIVDQATDQELPEAEEESDKNPRVKAGRKGGLKGGKARAKKLTAEERHQIAVRAALARWRKSSSE